MILYPSVDKLLERVDSRYKLIALGAKRAHELEQGALPTLAHFDSVKPIGQALKPVTLLSTKKLLSWKPSTWLTNYS